MIRTTILPARPGETDDETRLREALNRLCGQMLQTLDAALSLRTASDRTQQARNLARNHLTDFALKGMHAFHVEQAARTDQIRRTAAE